MYKNKCQNKLNAVGCKRVSDEKQIDGASLETQDKSINQFCRENNLNLLKIYADEGISGRTMAARGGLLKLLEEIQPGNFIIVHELSRFARNLAETVNTFIDLVRNKSCIFICLSPPIDSRRSDAEFLLGLFSTIYQQESKNISDRVKINMQRLSDEGKLLCRPPFGYVHTPTRRYVPDPEQQAVVQKIRIMYLCGVNQSEISRRLNNEGLGHVLNNNKKTKNPDAKFSRTTVNIILHNYGFIKDENSPKYTYPERVETWNRIMDSKTGTVENSETISIVESSNNENSTIDNEPVKELSNLFASTHLFGSHTESNIVRTDGSQPILEILP